MPANGLRNGSFSSDPLNALLAKLTCMDNVILARRSRVILRTISLIIGTLGIFCFFWSCMGLRTAAHAIVCLSSETAILLASDSERRPGR
jgi:hypothetical protein